MRSTLCDSSYLPCGVKLQLLLRSQISGECSTFTQLVGESTVLPGLEWERLGFVGEFSLVSRGVSSSGAQTFSNSIGLVQLTSCLRILFGGCGAPGPFFA